MSIANLVIYGRKYLIADRGKYVFKKSRFYVLQLNLATINRTVTARSNCLIGDKIEQITSHSKSGLRIS